MLCGSTKAPPLYLLGRRRHPERTRPHVRRLVATQFVHVVEQLLMAMEGGALSPDVHQQRLGAELGVEQVEGVLEPNGVRASPHASTGNSLSYLEAHARKTVQQLL